MNETNFFSTLWNLFIGLVATAITAWATSLSKRLKVLEDENASQDKALALLNQRHDEFDKQLHQNTDDMREIREKVNKIESSVAQISAQIDAIYQRVVKMA